MTRKPAHIITGFLGAGKTTFVNHFIKERLPERVIVIENECGSTSVDGSLIMDDVEKIVELSAGCLCCSLSDELVDVLENAGKNADQFDRLVIETTGIADPGSILQVFMENPRVECFFDLKQVICIVDAGLVEDWLQETEEALRQIAVADVLLINKADTVATYYLSELKTKLKNINPYADVLTGEKGIFPIEKLLNIGTVNPVSVESIAKSQNHHYHEHGEKINNDHNITTFTLRFPRPLDLNALQLELNRVVQQYKGQLYRVKGFIAIPGYPNRVILQSARSSIIATDGTPWEDETNRTGMLVFIGKGLNKSAIELSALRKLVFLIILNLAVLVNCIAQDVRIPASYSNIFKDETGLYMDVEGVRYYARESPPEFSIQQFLGQPEGTDDGIRLNFGELEGTITYGMIPYGQAPHPLPVFRFTKPLNEGKVDINIKENFRYPYDFVGWSTTGQFTIGYRLMDDTGQILFDGEVSASGTGPFTIAPTLYEGPFVSCIGPDQSTISFETSTPVVASIEVNGKRYSDQEACKHHEIVVNELLPGTRYDYKVIYGGFSQSYHFTTAPEKGSKIPFIFAYTSDSRHATGGGERRIYGTNGYIVKKMGALAFMQGAAFIQFTGDMINGYLESPEEQLIQYTNWKKSLEPFWHYIPVYVGQGNHEALGHVFRNEAGRSVAFIDKFPFQTVSAEAIMQQAFVNPVNGPESEDGAIYDPDRSQIDFPSYKENVFYYTYGNIAMIVLNSDYWYSPSLVANPLTSGGLHGYLMDNQLEWLKRTIETLEVDADIDHIFVTHHTPVFPNGGHSRDDMWYSGNNEPRPIVSGNPVEKGIIQRRDEYLDIIVNNSTKVIAILTGDEHNYNWMKVNNEVPIYPENYPYEKLNFSRDIYQINNGASGAPYYAQEVLPWSAFTKSFSVENALCLFYIEGNKVAMRVLNPDTLNEIDHLILRDD